MSRRRCRSRGPGAGEVDTDGDGAVDVLLGSASVGVESGDLAQGAFLQQALVYWGGTIAENANCGGPDSSIDETVEITVPQGAPTTVTADACFCSGADNQSRDVQACRADVSALVTEAGGQLGDRGTLGGPSGQAAVLDVQRPAEGLIVHLARVDAGELALRQAVRAEVDSSWRESIRRNHTATHLLNLALRDAAGEGHDQKGSQVAPDHLLVAAPVDAPADEPSLFEAAGDLVGDLMEPFEMVLGPGSTGIR